MPLCNQYFPYSDSSMITFLQESVVKKGRPHLLDPADCLGLPLGYTKTRSSPFALQMEFGDFHSVLCLFLKYSM
jgi:hypothetical protein